MLRPLIKDSLKDAITQPPAPLTEFERSAGRPMAFDAAAKPAEAGIQAKANLFKSQVLPSTQAVLTRKGHFGAWRAFVTFLLIEGVLHMAMPVTETAIQGFFMHLILTGYSGGRLGAFVEAIIDRHYLYNIELGVPAERIRWWASAAKKGLGLPAGEKYPILASHVKLILLLPRLTIKATRDAAMFCVGTVCALRAAEITRLDVCDLLWDIDGPGTLALLLWYRKNDGLKKGLFPRIGPSNDPRLSIIMLLKQYLRMAGLTKSEMCTKERWRRSPCQACGKLFRNKTMYGQQVMKTNDDKHCVAANTLCKVVFEQLKHIGIDTAMYSSVSMRKGGISKALAANVPGDLHNLQSGHRSTSWQNYASTVNRKQLYLFHKSFGL